jgi:uncharacterized protein (DUF1330 family)
MAVYTVSALEIFSNRRLTRDTRRAQQMLLASSNIEHLSGDGSPIGYEGSRPDNHLNIVKFESHEALESFYDSEAYRAALPDWKAWLDPKLIMLMRHCQASRLSPFTSYRRECSR